jgi:hypothetical protein
MTILKDILKHKNTGLAVIKDFKRDWHIYHYVLINKLFKQSEPGLQKTVKSKFIIT